jgi:hypothetical protein
MLSFDIETTGLDPFDGYVTVVCTHDANGTSTAYHLCKPVSDEHCSCTREHVSQGPGQHRCRPCQDWHANNLDTLFEALDNAPVLCGYNAIKFDIPYLQAHFAIPSYRVGAWVAKCVDVFFFVSEVLETMCSLNRMCMLNGMANGKTSSGKEAVSMAHEGRWDELERYCIQDAVITRELTSMRRIRAPAFGNSGGIVCIEWEDGDASWSVVSENGTNKKRDGGVVVKTVMTKGMKRAVKKRSRFGTGDGSPIESLSEGVFSESVKGLFD